MGVSSIEDVLPYVDSAKLEKLLTKCKEEHEKLDRELQEQLDRFPDQNLPDGELPVRLQEKTRDHTDQSVDQRIEEDFIAEL
jgi:hypothetical protein